MVYFVIPTDLTKEEKLLKKKYELLRKLQHKLKTPIQEPPPKKVDLKRKLEVKPDAKERAKKLLKSGAISALKKEIRAKTTFKRPQGSEKKDSARSRCRIPINQPLSTPPNSFSTGLPPNSASPEFNRRSVKRLYDNFVSAGKLQDEVKDQHYQHKERNDTTEYPREGNTVYVRGYSLTREFLQKAFGSIGNIMKIYIPDNNNCAFVTFKTNEFADIAIKTVGGTVSDGVRLSVHLAKRQFHLPSSSGNSPSWPRTNGSSNRNANRDVLGDEFD